MATFSYKPVDASQDNIKQPSFQSGTPAATGQETDILKLKKYLNLPNFDEILRESKSLDILVLGDLQESNVIVDGLTGIKWSCSKEVNRSTITTDDSTDEIVAYRARREGIDVTVWNAPSLSFHRVSYVQEIKKILETVDLKLLCISKCLNENILVKHVTDAFGIKFLTNSLILAPSSDTIERQIIPKRTLNHIGAIYKTLLFGTADYIIIFPPEIASSYSLWLSRFFFDCVHYLCSQNAKGSLLKLNLKRFKHVDVPCRANVMSVLYPVEELPLKFTVFEGSPLYCGSFVSFFEDEDDGILVNPRELFATEPPPQPPPEEIENKSEAVQELTHFYTGTHDLQFGAHGGGAQATPIRGPASNQEL